MAVLCLAGALLNIQLNRLTFLTVLPLPLYMDTVFTVALTFWGGLFWGILCGAITNLIAHTYWFSGWELYLYTICNIATALITWMFIRLFPRELDFSLRYAKHEQIQRAAGIASESGKLFRVLERVIALALLSFALCIAMSILGGAITTVILQINPARLEQRAYWGILSDTMFGENFSVLLTEILARIPINIADRLIAAFGGYGIALCLRKLSDIRQLNRR